ncbi:MAG: poly-gamma-glutamate hydrolase family protein [Desulfobacteraceae bacterium]|jgi:phage replication-related protein YjqB (UPF0714/DUF867 family)
MDAYRSFAELSQSEKEDVDFRILIAKRKESATVIIAPHGGAIEPGTSEVAKAVAGDDLSLALFEGIKPQGGNRRLHLTSTNFDEPRCVELVLGAAVVVAIHGEASTEPSVFLGGRDRILGARLKTVLKRHGYAVEAHGNTELHGLSTENICNCGTKGAGVQLELSRGLRRTFFRSLTDEGRKEPTDELFRFAAAVRQGLLSRR